MPTESIAITGASSGIGRAAACAFAARGAGTVLIARRRERLEALAERITTVYGTPVALICADLAGPRDTSGRVGAAIQLSSSRPCQ